MYHIVLSTALGIRAMIDEMSESDERDTFAELSALNDFMDELGQIAGYALPKDIDGLFHRAWEICLLASKNTRIAPQDQWKRWSEVRQRVNEVRLSLAAAHYHYDNVAQIEERVSGLCQRYRNTSFLRAGGITSPGTTSRLSFEYHAFVFAATRCLLYLSAAVGRAWDRRCPNLKSLKGLLSTPVDARSGKEELLSILQAHANALETMFSRETKRSIRDWIAHESFLHAGAFQIAKGNWHMKGALEKVFAHVDTGNQNLYRLSDVMINQLHQVEEFVVEMITALEKYRLPKVPGWSE